MTYEIATDKMPTFSFMGDEHTLARLNDGWVLHETFVGQPFGENDPEPMRYYKWKREKK